MKKVIIVLGFIMLNLASCASLNLEDPLQKLALSQLTSRFIEKAGPDGTEAKAKELIEFSEDSGLI